MSVHPWYGPCDALGPDGVCSECHDEAADGAVPSPAPMTTWTKGPPPGPGRWWVEWKTGKVEPVLIRDGRLLFSGGNYNDLDLGDLIAYHAPLVPPPREEP